eukprot:318026-Pelagomonas_calceolata.AAC.1
MGSQFSIFCLKIWECAKPSLADRTWEDWDYTTNVPLILLVKFKPILLRMFIREGKGYIAVPACGDSLAEA